MPRRTCPAFQGPRLSAPRPKAVVCMPPIGSSPIAGADGLWHSPAEFFLPLNLPAQCTGNLNGIGALLQPDNLAAVQGPHMSKSGCEGSPGSLRLAGVGAQGDDAIAGLEKLGAHCDEALAVLEETAKEVAEYVVEADVDTAVRKAFDDLPVDVRCQHLPNDVGVTARLVEPTDDSYMRGIWHDVSSSWDHGHLERTSRAYDPPQPEVQGLPRIVVCAQKVKGDIRLLPHHPAIVRYLRNVEELAGPKREHPPILQRCGGCARHHKPDMCHGAALSADSRANVLRPPPPRLVGGSADGEAADTDDLELSLLHHARLVGRFEPPKSHLELRWTHEALNCRRRSPPIVRRATKFEGSSAETICWIERHSHHLICTPFGKNGQ